MRDYRAKIAMGKADGGLLSFQTAFVQAICRENHPPLDRGVELPSWKRQVVVVRRDCGAIPDTGRSAVRAVR